MRKKYELIIFDCDGTLVDSEQITNSLIALMIKERGMEISQEECLHLFAGKTIRHITEYIDSNGVSIDHHQFEVEYRHRCDALFKRDLKPINGVHNLLESLDIPFCVASNGPIVKMNTTLPATGLSKYFNEKNIFSAYEIDSWKPDPELFLHAASEMGVDQNSCLVIEDTWSGVMGAINAGIDVWAFNPDMDRRLYLGGIPNFYDMSFIRQNLKYYI